jgi:uncharacterized SAM-binding protein YcdF (DUF218 family)
MSQAPFDAIIVPGYPFRIDKNRILFAVRLHFAKELYEKGIAKNIIFSGAAVQSPYIEGRVMKIIADSLGLPSEHTFVEDKALHSNQNALYGTRMARKMGFKKIAIATDPYQFSYMTLLLKFFAPKTGILTFYPSQMPTYDKPIPVIDSTDAFVKDFASPLK